MTDLMTRLIAAKREALKASDDVTNMLATVDAFLSDGQERRYELTAALALIDMMPTEDELHAMHQLVLEDYDAAIRLLSLPQQRGIDFGSDNRLAVIGRLGAARDRRLDVIRLSSEVLASS